MTLASDLRKNGIDWCIDVVDTELVSRNSATPGVVHQVSKLRVQLTDTAAAQSTGTSPKTVEYLLDPQSNWELERVLMLAMRKCLAAHPVYLRWMGGKGHGPAVLRTDCLDESLGECLHTALRKGCDGPMSAIQWNAIHHLAPADWAQLLDMTREAVRKVAQDASRAKNALTRWSVGLAIKEVFTDRMDEVRNRGYAQTLQNPKRTEMETFALLCLHQSCCETEIDEYVWGWTSYLCEDPPAPVAVPESAAQAA